MTPAQLLALYRSQSQDAVAPFFWSDEEIYAYLNDAQRILVRGMGGFVDSTSAVTTIDVTAGDKFIDISPLILKFVSIYDNTNKRNLMLKNVENLPAHEYSNIIFNEEPGELRYLVSDAQEGQLMLVDPPKEDLTIRMVVHRLPLVEIAVDNAEDDVLEVRDEHHIHLLLWMRRSGLLKQDSEVFDKAKADELEFKFLQYVNDAGNEQSRREHTRRVIKYGGI